MILTVLLTCGWTVGLSARESDRKDVRRGNRHFKDGEFKEAVVDYQKALLRDSTSFAATYNLANALYRLDKPQEGKAILDSAAAGADGSAYASDYFYNLGNMAVAVEDYKAAVDAYRESLLRNPGDLDAKENYIYARKKLQDQQDNQDNRNDQDNRDNKDNKDNQDNKDNRDNQNNQNDNQDNNNDNQNNRNGNDDRQDDGSSPQAQPQISPQAAQQMLNAIMAKEKETQDKVKKEKAAVMKSRQKEKNW